MKRRAFLAGLLSAPLARTALARGRTPIGGKVALRVPWPIGAIDPHRLDDPMAAIFGEALFDTLYATAEGGAIVPSLAEGEPEPDGATLRVKLRSGLRTARGKAFLPNDAGAAIARARSWGARGWLEDVLPVRVDRAGTLVFSTKDVERLKRALASPIVAMVPSGFNPETPDGTGPFRFALQGGAMVLAQNKLAARGPSFLDEITVRAAPNVSASLLAFEGGSDDMGWFERGLYTPRAGSKTFDFGAVGWVVLCTGREANDWDAPGVAQSVADGIPVSRMLNLHLGAPWTETPSSGWGGPPVGLLVREDAPWMIDVANAIAATITRPGHEVTVRTVPASELASRRGSRAFGLALDVVRNVGGGSLGAMVSLATSDSPSRGAEIMQHPPKLGEVAARTLTRTLRSGVIGEIGVLGGRVPDLVLAPSAQGFGFDLGASYRAAKKS